MSIINRLFTVALVAIVTIHQMRMFCMVQGIGTANNNRCRKGLTCINTRSRNSKLYSATRVYESSLSRREYENDIWNRGTNTHFIIGVDEAGRGPLAGPVVAAAAFVPRKIAQELLIKGIDDSKKITEKNRFRIYQEIIERKDIVYSSATAAHDVIDRDNILQATLSCMQAAIESLVDKLGKKEFHDNFNAFNTGNCIALIDGNKTPAKLSVSAKPVIKGDSLVYSIALASIVAKVERDLIMIKYDEMYPEYGFKIHKGYPTKAHIFAIHKYGPCPIHRMSFKPLKGREFTQGPILSVD